MRCPHCGNRAPHEYLHDEVVTWAERLEDFDDHLFEHRRWALLRCQTCGEASLHSKYLTTGDPTSDPVEAYHVHELELIWPDMRLPESVPETVRSTYREALRVKHHSANAFANQIRKSLEAVCEDRGAEGNNLHNMLGNLEAEGHLPSQLGEMTDLIRIVGNAGSHADRIDVGEQFVEPIDDFFRTAVRYIYELPNQIEELKAEYEAAEESEE